MHKQGQDKTNRKKNTLRKVKIGEFLRKERILLKDFTNKNLEVYGVSNKEGIIITRHKKSLDLSNYQVIKPEWFVYNPYRINVGSIGLVPDDVTGIVSPAYIVFSVDENRLLPELLLDFLKSSDGLDEIRKHSRGSVRKALRYSDLCQIEMLITDIAIQRRVYAKKKEINQKTARILKKLNSQQRDLSLLRQQILQDAISGKLTADWRKQNPDVEPASVLLEKIKKEKERLIKEGKIKKQKPLPPVEENEIPFKLPERWVWTRLGEVVKPMQNINIHKKFNATKIINYIDIDCIDSYKHTIEKIKSKAVSDLSSRARRLIQSGDILYSMVRPYLQNIAIFNGEQSELYIGSTGLFICKPVLLANNYLFYYLLSPYIRTKHKNLLKGFNSPSINVSNMLYELVPVPPLKEQQAIVKKVSSLFQKLDQIEKLNTENQKNIELLQQVVLKGMFSSQKYD